MTDIANQEASRPQALGGNDTWGLKAILGSAEAPAHLQELQSILTAVPPASTIESTHAGLLASFKAARKSHEHLAVVYTQHITLLQAPTINVNYPSVAQLSI